MEDLRKYISDPSTIVMGLGRRGFFNWMSDERYVSWCYRLRFKKRLNLKNPITYNEKLQWCKIHDRNPRYIPLVDKYLVKKYIANIIGEEYIIPTLGMWKDAKEIDFTKLPDKFVLKCNHDSGSVIVCKSKASFNKEDAITRLNAGLNRNGFGYGREWLYRNVEPCILAEQYMEDEKTKELRDYKFFCFDGEVKLMFIASDRQSRNEETKFDFFDMDFKPLYIKNVHPMSKSLPEKPKSFEKMKSLAKILSQGFAHVRVDFYEVNGKPYFSELTFIHGNGMLPFEPSDWDERIGNWFVLPKPIE